MAGEFDVESAARIDAAFGTLSAAGCTRIDVDLSEVDFVDAYVLGLLHRMQHRLADSGGYLRVAAASTWCITVCRLAHYDTLLPVDSGAVPAERHADC